jgi:hypothetical protein
VCFVATTQKPGADDINAHAPGIVLAPPRLSPWAWAAVLCSAAAELGIAWNSAERIGIERLRDTGLHKLDLYEASLESALAKYDYLPGVVALPEEVVGLLRSPSLRRSGCESAFSVAGGPSIDVAFQRELGVMSHRPPPPAPLPRDRRCAGYYRIGAAHDQPFLPQGRLP